MVPSASLKRFIVSVGVPVRSGPRTDRPRAQSMCCGPRRRQVQHERLQLSETCNAHHSTTSSATARSRGEGGGVVRGGGGGGRLTLARPGPGRAAYTQLEERSLSRGDRRTSRPGEARARALRGCGALALAQITLSAT
eukprot:3940835-Rhodomonas_salina.4